MTKKIKQLKPHLVLYLDILGIQSKIICDESEKYLNIIYSFFFEVKQHCEELLFRMVKRNIFFKIFSDNIIVAIPVVSKTEKDIEYIAELLVFMASIFYAKALGYRLLIRGALSFGELYIDNIFVFGKALLDGYNLENNCAIYPRILVSDDYGKLLRNEFISENLSFDTDGFYYLNLDLTFIKDKNAVKNFIDESLHKFANRKNVFQKFNWLHLKYEKMLNNMRAV